MKSLEDDGISGAKADDDASVDSPQSEAFLIPEFPGFVNSAV